MGSDAEGNWMLCLLEITFNLELVQQTYLKLLSKISNLTQYKYVRFAKKEAGWLKSCLTVFNNRNSL